MFLPLDGLTTMVRVMRMILAALSTEFVMEALPVPQCMGAEPSLHASHRNGTVPSHEYPCRLFDKRQPLPHIVKRNLLASIV